MPDRGDSQSMNWWCATVSDFEDTGTAIINPLETF
jgi:hypothetical protein